MASGLPASTRSSTLRQNGAPSRARYWGGRRSLGAESRSTPGSRSRAWDVAGADLQRRWEVASPDPRVEGRSASIDRLLDLGSAHQPVRVLFAPVPGVELDSDAVHGKALRLERHGYSLWVPEIVSWLVRRHACIR